MTRKPFRLPKLVGKDETRHLLSSPKNAERLLRSIADLEAGKTVEFDLIDQ